MRDEKGAAVHGLAQNPRAEHQTVQCKLSSSEFKAGLRLPFLKPAQNAVAQVLGWLTIQ